MIRLYYDEPVELDCSEDDAHYIKFADMKIVKHVRVFTSWYDGEHVLTGVKAYGKTLQDVTSSLIYQALQIRRT